MKPTSRGYQADEFDKMYLLWILHFLVYLVYEIRRLPCAAVESSE